MDQWDFLKEAPRGPELGAQEPGEPGGGRAPKTAAFSRGCGAAAGTAAACSTTLGSALVGARPARGGGG